MQRTTNESKDRQETSPEAIFAKDDQTANLKTNLDRCLNYLDKLNVPTLLNETVPFKLLQYLRYLSNKNGELAKKLLDKSSLIQKFIDVLAFYKPELNLLTFSNQCTNTNLTQSRLDSLNHQFDFVNEVISVFCNLSNSSKVLCYKFHEFKGSEIILNYLNDTILVQKLLKFERKNCHGVDFLNNLLTTLFNVSSIADYRKEDFERLNTTTIIRKIIDQIDEQYSDLRIVSFLLLANIIKDHEIETLPCTKQALENIVKLIRIAANMIVKNENVNRIHIDVDMESKKSAEVCHLMNGWHIVELFNGLYRLAINDKIKFFIYNDLHIMDELKKIICHGNDIEVEYALKVLWQLCFDNEIAKSIQEDDILKYIEILLNKKESSQSVKKSSEGILWSVKKAKGESLHVESNNNTKKKHIMISYNSFSRDLCLKIKDELEKLGYNVWIDVEQIHGSSLEAMADAVENSKCVLMCMTEKYKQSPNCRAEAEYAFRCNKVIIPLIMQPSYMPDGWLGIIMGSKIFINFTKYTFEECCRRLIVELKPLDRPVSSKPIQNSEDFQKVDAKIVGSQPISSPKQGVRSWKIRDVQKWLEKCEFQEDIVNMLKNFDGEELTSLNSIRLKAPEYFYRSLTDQHSLNFISIVQFNTKFEKLFEN